MNKCAASLKCGEKRHYGSNVPTRASTQSAKADRNGRKGIYLVNLDARYATCEDNLP